MMWTIIIAVAAITALSIWMSRCPRCHSFYTHATTNNLQCLKCGYNEIAERIDELRRRNIR